MLNCGGKCTTVLKTSIPFAASVLMFGFHFAHHLAKKAGSASSAFLLGVPCRKNTSQRSCNLLCKSARFFVHEFRGFCIYKRALELSKSLPRGLSRVQE